MKSKAKQKRFRLGQSLFQKYLGFGLFILFISFLTLGISVYFYVHNYWESEKKTSLLDSARQVAEITKSSTYYLPLYGMLKLDDGETFDTMIHTIAEPFDAAIFVVDSTGKCIYCSEDEKSCIHRDAEFPNSILATTMIYGEFYQHGTLYDFDKDSYYTAGVPVKLDYMDDPGLYCFVSTKATLLSAMPMRFLKFFFFALFLTLLVVVVVVFLMSYSMTRPLRQMSSAAKRFAVGDFSTRVQVTTDDELGELAQAFNEMADSLSASEGMRRSFIANVSHELKTPMTTIAGFIDGMLDGTIPKERHPHYMKIVSGEVKRLSRLVTSMLSLSRIDNGELKLACKDFEMFSMIITILTTFEKQIEEKRLAIRGLENFESLKVFADPDLMYQVIYNIIENAVKFTPEEGYIEFSAEETRFDLSIAIQNSGPGIPPEDIRYIFDRFYKTDKSRSMDKKGMGLGLFIAKSIMRLHGGDIWVESEVNVYTRFTFRLPKQIPQKTAPPTSKSKKDSRYIETTANSETEE